MLTLLGDGRGDRGPRTTSHTWWQFSAGSSTYAGWDPTAAASPSTAHVSAVDADGTACGVTTSHGYGSGATVPGTGLWLNNCLGERELNRSAGVAPGERLASNMAPTVGRRDDGAVLALGSPGADRITTALLQVLASVAHAGPVCRRRWTGRGCTCTTSTTSRPWAAAGCRCGSRPRPTCRCRRWTFRSDGTTRSRCTSAVSGPRSDARTAGWRRPPTLAGSVRSSSPLPRLLQVLLLGRLAGRRGSRKIRLLAVRMGAVHVERLVELCRAGTVDTRIDRRFPLSEAAEALRYLGDGHARGKVVVVPDQG